MRVTQMRQGANSKLVSRPFGGSETYERNSVCWQQVLENKRLEKTDNLQRAV
jgi:hypothetical protein